MSQQPPEPGPPPHPAFSGPQPPHPGSPDAPLPGDPSSPGSRPAGLPLSQGDENLWALVTHLSIPFVGFVGPFVVQRVFRGRSSWLAENVLEALNFSLLYTIAVVACGVFSVVVVGALLLPVVVIGAFVLAVSGAVAANRHQLYRYPVNWRLVR